MLLCALAVAVMSGAAAPAPPAIAVVYPDVGEPYRSVFASIIRGIEEQTRNPVTKFATGGTGPDAQEILGELRRKEIRVVIALGRNGVKLASGLGDVSVVAGGVLSLPDAEARNMAVLSLAPDPALLFARLHALVPTARRINVVYDPKQNAWLIQLARDAAKAQGLELVAHPASDLKSAVQIYSEIMAKADPTQDALWLPQDALTAEDGIVLPLVLQESWSRNIPFFSSSVAHVRRGALFSLYPNNVEVGRALAGSALALVSGSPTPRGVLPLRNVLLAVNLRTAGHLGINVGNPQKIDLVFPEP